MATPKKGKAWLEDKLKEGNRLWHEPQTTRFNFRHESAYLVDLSQPADADLLFGDLREARNKLHATEAIELLSIRVRARDMRHRGKLVETWIRGSLLRKLIERPKPNRDGFGHDRYSILIGFLLNHGLLEPDTRNGYRWCEAYRHMPARAEWLISLIRREGELRQVAVPRRFTFLD